MNQLVIDLDSLTAHSAERFASMLRAYTGKKAPCEPSTTVFHTRAFVPKTGMTGHQVIEAALAEALDRNTQDFPFGLSAEEGAIWKQATASAYQHALEMIPVPAPTLTADQVAAVDETAGIPDSGHIAPGYGPVTAKQYEEFVTTGTIVGLAVKFPEQLLPPAPSDAQPVGRIDPTRVSPPPVPAPSTAAAAPLPTAPVEQQAGAAATPSASTPPAPSVPMPPAPSAPAGTGSPVLDAAGLPWDDRIHSGSKALNADKTWRARRNMSDEQKAAVPGIEAELRQRVAGPSAHPALGHETAPLTVLHTPAAPAASAAPLPPVPAPAPTAPAPDGGTDASASPVPANAVELTLKVTKLGKMLGEDELQRACASVGLPDSPQCMLYLFAAAEKDPTIVARLDAEIEAILAN